MNTRHQISIWRSKEIFFKFAQTGKNLDPFIEVTKYFEFRKIAFFFQ